MEIPLIIRLNQLAGLLPPAHWEHIFLGHWGPLVAIFDWNSLELVFQLSFGFLKKNKQIIHLYLSKYSLELPGFSDYEVQPAF